MFFDIGLKFCLLFLVVGKDFLGFLDNIFAWHPDLFGRVIGDQLQRYGLS